MGAGRQWAAQLHPKDPRQPAGQMGLSGPSAATCQGDPAQAKSEICLLMEDDTSGC